MAKSFRCWRYTVIIDTDGSTGVISTEAPRCSNHRSRGLCHLAMATNATPSSRKRDGTDIKGTGLVHDIAEPLYGGREEVARCRSCGRETLWADREHLTHADGCEVADATE